MEALETAELKDSILLYLFDCAQWRITLSEIYYDLDLAKIPKDNVRQYVEDMVMNKLISSIPISGGRDLYQITELGKMRLKNRGHSKLLGIEPYSTEPDKFILSKSELK